MPVFTAAAIVLLVTGAAIYAVIVYNGLVRLQNAEMFHAKHCKGNNMRIVISVHWRYWEHAKRVMGMRAAAGMGSFPPVSRVW